MVMLLLLGGGYGEEGVVDVQSEYSGCRCQVPGCEGAADAGAVAVAVVEESEAAACARRAKPAPSVLVPDRGEVGRVLAFDPADGSVGEVGDVHGDLADLVDGDRFGFIHGCTEEKSDFGSAGSGSAEGEAKSKRCV